MESKATKYGMYDKNLMDRIDEIISAFGYQALSSAGLVIGSTSKKAVKIANTVTFLNAGVFKSKTTAEVAFTATTHDIAADESLVQEACYLMTLQADGTPVLTVGDIASGAGSAVLPEIPSGETPIGYVRIAVDAGSTDFDATSDDLDASHLTVTYYSMSIPPVSEFNETR